VFLYFALCFSYIRIFAGMLSCNLVLVGVMCAALAVRIEGSAFLHATPQHSADRVSTEDVQNTLLSEIEGSLGSGIASKRISDMKALLSPIFASMPKNSHGNLEHVTVRYVLHRVFVQRHGWSIKGLDPKEEPLNSSSSATGILKDHVPAYIQSMFEQRLEGRGLGLQELAVFAATMEHLVHNEAVGRLGSALSLHELLPTASMSPAMADKVLDTYMMAYILGEHLSNMTQSYANSMTEEMPEIFMAWGETQQFVRKVRQDMSNAMTVGSQPQENQELSFALLVKTAETIGEKFGKFQDGECTGLKSALMKMEDRQSGRVRLADFYKPALDGAWQFQESIAYLRQLGALDESNPEDPRVMIPNYLYSQTNCIASSDYYSVCCLNECEDLQGHLEKQIAAPEATPERIAGLVSSLASSSVPAPRQLSETLRSRLDKIAEEHGGSVQLHGRLFAQWMHHAYPRECPYPHISGTTSQQSAAEWGDDAVATEDELRERTSQTKPTSDIEPNAVDDMHDLMMWSHEEELLVARNALAPPATVGYLAGARNVALFGALAYGVWISLARTSATSKGTSDSSHKFMV